VNSGINLFSLSVHIGSTLKQFCVVRHCVRRCIMARTKQFQHKQSQKGEKILIRHFMHAAHEVFD